MEITKEQLAGSLLLADNTQVTKLTVIAAGGTSTTWIGTYQAQPVALKVFNLKTIPGHLIKEFASYAYLRSPYLIPVYGLINRPGKACLITALAVPLHIVYQHMGLSHQHIIAIAYYLYQGLAYLHSYNVAHKHLKGRNILVNPYSLQVMLADWDLSKLKLESSSAGATGQSATVRWRAPETFTREYAKLGDPTLAAIKADLFSAAATVYELGYAQEPFQGLNETEVVKALTSGVTPLRHRTQSESTGIANTSAYEERLKAAMDKEAIASEVKRRQEQAHQARLVQLEALEKQLEASNQLTTQFDQLDIAAFDCRMQQEAPEPATKKFANLREEIEAAKYANADELWAQVAQQMQAAAPTTQSSLSVVMPLALIPIITDAFGAPDSRPLATTVLLQLEAPEVGLENCLAQWRALDIQHLIAKVGANNAGK